MTHAAPATKEKLTGTKTRKDIQALRALAVGAVVIYHIWPGALPGGFIGVDVFFVISGYLITSHLLRQPPQSGADLANFWARRVRRLLPASYLVLAATVAATVLLAPSTALIPTLRETGAAALYVENWSLAAQSIDYLGAESSATPVQHFWSLSVEEQFYLIWPLVLLASAWWATRRRFSVAATAHVAIITLVVVSLIWSIIATATSPASAYFITPTRIWELGAGAAIATSAASSQRHLPEKLRVPVSWIGIALILGSAVVMDSTTPFPGWTALFPVAGAVFVILAETPRNGLSPRLIGDLRPVQWTGDISYSLYLWHWPIVVLTPFVVGGNPSFFQRCMILVLALSLAAITKPQIEDRFRRHRGRASRTLLVTVLVSATVGAACFFVAAILERQADSRVDAARTAAMEPCVGAAALDPTANCPDNGNLVLSVADAAVDKPSAYSDGCWESPPFKGTTTCSYGTDDADTRIALIGNSHAGGLLAPLQELADQEDWSLTTLVASECPTSAAEWAFDQLDESASCLAWGARVQEAVLSGDYDLVVTAQLTPFAVQGSTGENNAELTRDGYSEYLAQFADSEIPVLVVHDTPYPKHTLKTSVPECLASAGTNNDLCDGTRSDWLHYDPLYDAAQDLENSDISTLDLSDHICEESVCPAIVGGVVVYFDASHLTDTYSRTLTPYLRPTLEQLLE